MIRTDQCSGHWEKFASGDVTGRGIPCPFSNQIVSTQRLTVLTICARTKIQGDLKNYNPLQEGGKKDEHTEIYAKIH